MFVWMVTCMLVGIGVPLSLLTTEEAECYDQLSVVLGILHECLKLSQVELRQVLESASKAWETHCVRCLLQLCCYLS